MTVKDRLFDALAKESNPWQSYTGDQGGDGWINTRTGEVRYQETRPEPGEGGEDDTGSHGAAEDYEVGENVDAVPDDYGPIDWEQVEEGDPVIVADEAGGPVGEVVGYDEDTGQVQVDTGDGNVIDVPLDHVHGAPAQPPPEGFADGWLPPRSQDFGRLNGGQQVELYDIEADEYVQGEVDFVGDDGNAMDVVTEDGDTISVGDPDYAHDVALTAVEDPDYIPFETGPEIEPTDLYGLDEGDEVVIDLDQSGFEPAEGVVTEADPSLDMFTVEWEDEDGTGRKWSAHVHGWDAADVYQSPAGFVPVDEIPGLGGEAPDWDLLNEQEARLDHPAFGEVQGELSVAEDPEGETWLGVQTGTLPKNATPGDEVYYPFEDRVAEVIEEPDTAVGAGPEMFIGTEGGNWVGVDYDSVEPVGEEAAVTTNPDHPLYYEDHLEGAENPWTAIEDPDGLTEDLKVGDDVIIDGDRQTVEHVTSDGEVRTGEGWVDDTAAVDHARLQDPIDPPEGADEDEWQSPVNISDDGEDVEAVTFHSGDTVYYHDPESGEMQTEEVYSHHGDTVHFGPSDAIDFDQIQGYAETGSPMPPPAEQIDADALGAGDTIQWMASKPNGEIETQQGVILGEGGGWGNTDFNVIPEDGAESMIVTPAESDTAVVETGVDVSGFGEYDGFQMQPDEVVENIRDDVDLGDTLETSHHLEPEEKDAVRAGLMQHYGTEPVADFYAHQSESPGSWKEDSGTAKAETYERAYKEALDISASYRQRGGTHPNGNMVAVAEAAAELSQQHFREHLGEEADLWRGCSSTTGQSLAAQWLTDPTRDEYRAPFYAIQNFSQDRDTASSFDNNALIRRRTSADEAVAMHDHLFTSSGSHDSETEVTVRGDANDIAADGAWVGQSQDLNLGTNIENLEFNADDASSFNTWLDTNAYHISEELNSIGGGGGWTPGAIDNALRLEARISDQGVKTHSNTFFETARKEAQDNGIDPDQYDNRASADFDYGDWEAIADNIEPGDGVPVQFYDEYHGEVVQGEVIDVYSGDVLVWDEQDMESEIDAEDITWVDEVEFDNALEADDDPFPNLDTEPVDSVGDIAGGDTVLYQGAFDSEKDQHDVAAVHDDGSVELEDGSTVPSHEVGDLDRVVDPADGSDDTGGPPDLTDQND